MKHDETEVSPVYGVILMVAITVVIAAVVFVLVRDPGNPLQDPVSVVYSNGEVTCVQDDNGLVTCTDNRHESETCSYRYTGGRYHNCLGESE